MTSAAPKHYIKGMAKQGRNLTPFKKLPPASKRAVKSGCTQEEAAFVTEYVNNGGKAGPAAVRIGKTAPTGYNWYNRPHVRAAIIKEIRYRDAADAALGRDVLRQLAENAESEHVRIAAAKELLNRAMPVTKEERRTIEFKFTPEERRQRIAELTRELKDEKIIEADFTEVVQGCPDIEPEEISSEEDEAETTDDRKGEGDGEG